MKIRAIWIASSLLTAVVAAPSQALAYDLFSAGGFEFDPDDDGSGAMVNGSSDAYDTCYRLRVNGTAYDAGTAATVSGDGRHLYMTPDDIDGLVVERHFYVPASGGDYGRYLDLITNPGPRDVTVTVEIYGNLGSDSATHVTGTSSGDTVADTSDLWAATDDSGDGSGDPSIAHVFRGAGAELSPSSVSIIADDDIAWTYEVTIPAGERRGIVTFAVQADDRATSHAEATRIAAGPLDTLVGLEPYGPEIVNFCAGGAPCAQISAPSEIDEGEELVITANVFDLEEDLTTWSWDLDGDGVFGELPDTETYTIPAGTTDGDSEIAVAVQATDGTSSRSVSAKIFVRNVAPAITSEPPLSTAGAEYRYQMVVEDPGGALDPLVFRLGGSVPSGMAVDENGLITWRPAPQARGRTFTIHAQVLDDDRGHDEQSWELVVGLNTPPEPPTPVSPLELTRLSGDEPVTLVAENGSDADGDDLVYIFEIGPNSTFEGRGVIGSGEVEEGEGSTSWTTPGPLAEGTYYWRVWANDGQGDSLMRHGTFIVGPAMEPQVDAGGQAGDAGVGDAGTVTPPSGGCSVTPGTSSSGWLVALAALALVFLRRRSARKLGAGLALVLAVALPGCTNEPPLIPERDGGPQQMDVDAGSACENGIRDGDESHVDCGGSCSPCDDGANCARESDCKSGVCNRGYCLSRSCDDGVRNGPESDIDCGGDCGPCADGLSCSSNAQCASRHCRSSMCVPSYCDDGRKNGQETDTDCGGPECAPCAFGDGCRDASDCASLRCDDGMCEAASCGDRIQNQDETSVDCGGVVCAPCGDGLACDQHIDCTSQRCLSGGCVSCADGVQNADETDVDCGGGVCDGCADGKMCLADTDCRSGRCLDGACVSCEDGVQNGDESDVDCGGTLCGGCDNGAMCADGADCASGNCVGGFCVGVGDTCLSPWELTTGANTVPWVATAQDYLPVRPHCTSSDVDGPDIVLSYTATANGYLSYEIEKPTSQRWVVVVSSGECGTLTPEVDCFSDFSPAMLNGTFPVVTGETYYFYVADTTSGSGPLSNPLTVHIDETVPSCTPSVSNAPRTLATGISSGTEYSLAVDDDPNGYVYINGTSILYRVPKAGGAVEDVESLANLTSSEMGYEMVIAGDEIFTIDNSTSSTTNRVVRISADGGTTWIDGGESYATFSSSPDDDFRGATVHGGTMYLITHELTTSAATEIWSLPVGASTIPVTPTLVGTIPHYDCTSLAADSTYFYTMCENEDEIVRIDRATLATESIPANVSLSSTRNALAIDDSDGDGVADIMYYQVASEDVYFHCLGATPFGARFATWGSGTANYGLAFDHVSNVLYAYDDDTHELIVFE